MAIDPRQPTLAWTVWGGAGLYRSQDGGQAWQHVAVAGFATKIAQGNSVNQSTPVLADAEFTAVRFDPLGERLYIGVVFDNPNVPPLPTAVYALDAQGHVDRFAAGVTSPGDALEVTRNGFMLSWCNVWCETGSRAASPLTVRRLIAVGNWGVSASFSPAAAHVAIRLLGQPLSPTDTCGNASCQYFAKGAIRVQGHDSYTVVALVPGLIGAKSPLPVGASVSSLTYRDLFRLHNQRTPLPAGFRHGTLAVSGGTFVPYSPTLSPASGYVVPSVFWRYLTDRRQAPDGCQRDFGLPLTPAVAATVRKGRLGTRQIMVQAFEKAILTYDPRNAAPFRVERANVGADYAAFPAAVR